MPASRFEKIKRTVGVYRKIHVGIPGRPVVRGLRRRMDDRPNPGSVTGENVHDCFHVANVQIAVRISTAFAFQLKAIGNRGGFGSEKAGSHVIVDSDDLEALPMKFLDRFRPD